MREPLLVFDQPEADAIIAKGPRFRAFCFYAYMFSIKLIRPFCSFPRNHPGEA